MSKNEKQSPVPTATQPVQQPEPKEARKRTLSLRPLEARVAPLMVC